MQLWTLDQFQRLCRHYLQAVNEGRAKPGKMRVWLNGLRPGEADRLLDEAPKPVRSVRKVDAEADAELEAAKKRAKDRERRIVDAASDYLKERRK